MTEVRSTEVTEVIDAEAPQLPRCRRFDWQYGCDLSVGGRRLTEATEVTLAGIELAIQGARVVAVRLPSLLPTQAELH